MNNEGLLWIGLIMSSPLIYMISKMFFDFLISLFSRSEKVTIVIDKGHGQREEHVFHLDKNDELIALMKTVRATSASGRSSEGES